MKLVQFVKFKSGRNKQGSIIFRARGSRNKRVYRFVDLKMFLSRIIPYIIFDIEYDPYRNNFIMLVYYFNGICSYRIFIEGVKIGAFFSDFFYDRNKAGNVSLVKDAPIGKEVSLISSSFNNAIFARSAGSFVFVLKFDYKLKLALLKLMSGLKYIISFYNCCVIGKINNFFRNNLRYGKAGKKRNLGYKLIVRGIAMNPVDHPNCGRTPVGKVYRSFSFKIARDSKKTSNKKFANIFISKIIIKK